MDNFDLKKYLAEGRLLKNTTNPILESIFDKVATMVKGKSDKEAAAIDAFKKNGIEVGKPFYQFKYGGGSGKDGDNSFWMKDIATPEELKDLKVPVPVGFTGDRISSDVLVKGTLQELKEDEDGVVKVTIVAGDYNFKTGKFIDSDGANTFDVEDADSIEKDLGGEKEMEDKIYSNIEMVPFEGSPWVK
tara:strand:+ start:23 stop:589 length:567 start_codon:yes stop_codon:yes gene_type:complete